MTGLNQVFSKKAPEAIGPYSQAIIAGRFVFVSGQVGIDPATGLLAEGVVEQTSRVIRNLSAVLEGAGAGLSDVVRTTVFLAEMEDFAAMNKVYGELFPGKPARSTVAVKALPRGARVEIDCIAVIP